MLGAQIVKESGAKWKRIVTSEELDKGNYLRRRVVTQTIFLHKHR
jgi:hypothetical protein